MKRITMSVSQEPQEFFLITEDGWIGVLGHLLTLNNLKFSAVPLEEDEVIRISEVGSGTHFMDIDVPNSVVSYEEAMLFMEVYVSAQIASVIRKFGLETIENRIYRMTKQVIKQFGNPPEQSKVEIKSLC